MDCLVLRRGRNGSLASVSRFPYALPSLCHVAFHGFCSFVDRSLCAPAKSLTRRWSERPPAAHLRSASLQPVRCDPPSFPVAVAHLILVRWLCALRERRLMVGSSRRIRRAPWSRLSAALFLESHLSSDSDSLFPMRRKPHLLPEPFSSTLLVKPRPPSNQTMERTATRCALTFPVFRTLPFQAAPALGGRRSSYSR